MPRVRVIGSDGEMIGVLSRDEALAKAEDEGMDLVEIQPNADPPVCRIMDFGKFKFETQNSRASKKSRSSDQEVKFVRSPTKAITPHLRRCVSPERATSHVNIRFLGREMCDMELGRNGTRIEADLGEDIVIESRPRLEGRQMVMMIARRKIASSNMCPLLS